MVTVPGSAAIYARISSDLEGSGLGVARQLQDCRALAASLGWEVGEEYVDNDLSAYSGKVRPAYVRMLGDVREGLRDAVVVYHVDRLTRRPAELEEFLVAIDAAKIRQVRFVVGDMDLGTGDGLMIARIMGAMAANESATKSRRVKRKLDQNAAQGLPHGGAQRPYGYEPDKVTVRESEAVVVRTVVARFLAGESLRSLATWLDQEGLRTVSGGPWRTTTLKAMLCSARIAGLREHRGQVVGPAVWASIVSVEDRDRVLARFTERAQSGRRVPQRYLLSGMLRCGKCGRVLYSSPRASTRRYVCLSGPDHGGCGRLTVVAEPVEELIAQGVMWRLDTPELADAMAGRSALDERTAVLAEALSQDRAMLDELAAAFAARQVSMREWLAARGPIEARIRDHEARLSRQTRAGALTGLAGHGQVLASQWQTLSLPRRHAIVAAVLDHAVVTAGVLGARTLDPTRVKPQWRL